MHAARSSVGDTATNAFTTCGGAAPYSPASFSATLPPSE